MRESIDETVLGRGPGLSTDDLGFLFEPAHAKIAESARSVIRSILAREKQGGSEHAIARDTVAILGKAGLGELFSDPKKVDLRGICVAREALGWASGSADSLFAVQGLGTYPIAAWGSEAQRAAYLPELRTGARVGAFGLTEPNAGTDVASLETVAVRDGDRWKLTGRKTFISNAPVADHVVLFANADPSKGRKGITAFIVKKGAPGLRVHEDLPLVADHSIGSLELEDCLVEDGDRLGNVGDGFRIAMATLDTFRVTVGAAAVGMARRALEEAVHRVTVRHQFGKPIADQQQVQAYLADSIAELDASRLLVLRAAKLRDDGAASITQEAAIAKMFATEAAQRIIDRCLQLHGGMGVVRGVAVERLYREIRALRIYEGTTEIQRVVIATRTIQSEREKSR